MCLSPINLYSPTKAIALRGGQVLKQTVRCGKCAHCQTRLRDEYSFRTYWHTKDTIDNGGYVLFDTLTYDEENLPHISDFVDIKKYGIKDFSCFNRQHYKLFFKRLRRKIERTYGLVKAISYFFSTEYGEDDRYTHRPHYHILIFVKRWEIDPIWLSYAIAECWQYGRTDGLKYQPLKHVAEHVYGYNLGFGENTDTFVLRAVTHYVSKYITKNNLFQKNINERINIIEHQLPPDDEETIKFLKSQINMFHQQSQGYGLAYLNYMTDREIDALDYDEGLIPDKDKVVKSIPLPTYFMRKLYYDNIKLSDGRRVWQLNEKGISHKAKTQLKQVYKHVEQIETLLKNASEEQNTDFYRLLGNREIYDYVIYCRFYCGRLRHYQSVNYLNGQSDNTLSEVEEIDNTTWHDSINNSYYNNTLDSTLCAYVDDLNDVTVNNFIDTESVFPSLDPFCPFKLYDKKDFVRFFTFNESSDPRFKNFDILTDLITYMKNHQNKNAQQTFDFKEEYKNRIKKFKHIKES